MDVLSEVLRAVKLEGALFFNGEFSTPWCLPFGQATAIAPILSPGGGHLVLYHFLTEGRAYARLPGGQLEELRAGDIVVFPRGDAHVLGNGSPVKPAESHRRLVGRLRRARPRPTYHSPDAQGVRRPTENWGSRTPSGTASGPPLFAKGIGDPSYSP